MHRTSIARIALALALLERGRGKWAPRSSMACRQPKLFWHVDQPLGKRHQHSLTFVTCSERFSAVTDLASFRLACQISLSSLILLAYVSAFFLDCIVMLRDEQCRQFNVVGLHHETRDFLKLLGQLISSLLLVSDSGLSSFGFFLHT